MSRRSSARDSCPTQKKINMVECKVRDLKFEVDVQNDLASNLPENVEVLVQLHKETENAIHHLRKSNIELKEFDPDKKDPDFQAAIIENRFVIMKKENLLKRIAEKIEELNPTAYKVLTQPPLDPEDCEDQDTNVNSCIPSAIDL
eukprot:Gregarina_sp_Poly_1__8701@NODE_51_length_17570_cov_53_504028_g42_i1_p13_GENE_NODE_51_length_17570_cov_53_504028_g42_i1NODE_51_length_17570_cov_53_504028_g42_i1_p13_ORF_typecomplete_len145_score27_71CAGE1/PF15066_6/0_0007Herpes_UL14/PF03580_14/0_91Herpes_UL14/PF03580_14/3_6e02UPF0242/PF06785_11/3_9UPF0242/PF06785_11/14_NODE_51_length_17570_cov_53_504028_g42_i11261913053